MRSLPVSPGSPIAAPLSSKGLNHLEDWRRKDLFRQLFLAAGRRDLGCEIGFLLVDSLAESIAHKSGDLDRRAAPGAEESDKQMAEPVYRRVVVKLSGEFLAGSRQAGRRKAIASWLSRSIVVS